MKSHLVSWGWVGCSFFDFVLVGVSRLMTVKSRCWTRFWSLSPAGLIPAWCCSFSRAEAVTRLKHSWILQASRELLAPIWMYQWIWSCLRIYFSECLWKCWWTRWNHFPSSLVHDRRSSCWCFHLWKENMHIWSFKKALGMKYESEWKINDGCQP